jgi:threonine dehydrogenase-like Zn-dependent dehydrogenase
MLQKLQVNKNFDPELFKCEEKALAKNCVRVKSIFGAPKHGTETTVFKFLSTDKLYYDGNEHIFKELEQESSAEGFGLGNMWVGEIIEMGEEAEGFKLGQRVAGYGALSQTHDAKPEHLLDMPESMSWQEAVCYDPLQFALSGLRDANCRIGDTVLVSGLGAIGQMAAQAAKLAGASFVAVADPLEIRREAALENGADIAFDPEKQDAGLILRGMTDGKGVDAVIECSGDYKAIEQGIRALGYMGSMALVGWYKECRIPINLGREGHFNQQNIFFSRACSEPNRDYPRWDFARICRETWKLLTDGKIKCGNLLYPVIDFAECDKAYDEYIIRHPENSIKLGVKF